MLALTLGVSSKHVEYTIEADPKLFEQVAGEELIAPNRMLIARMREVVDGIGVEAPATAAASAPETDKPLF